MLIRAYKLGPIIRVVAFKRNTNHSSFCYSADDSAAATQTAAGTAAGRFDTNICRAKSTIRELGLCNPWQYFVTITINQANQDRSDLGLFKRRLNQCIKDFNKAYACSLKYLLIPEQHADMASWHCHGLLMGVPRKAVQRNANGYPSIPYFERRIGFVSISRIKSLKRVSSYITKYVTKSYSAERLSAFQKNEHLFVCSTGLNRKELLEEIHSNDRLFPFTYENDYVKIFECNQSEYAAYKQSSGIAFV